MVDYKVVQLFLKGFPQYENDFEKAERVLEKYKSNLIVYWENDNPVFLTMFAMVDHVMIFKIATCDIWRTQLDKTFEDCFRFPGNNVHFLFATGKAIPYAVHAVREVRNRFKPSTVSWFKNDMENLHVISERKTLCLH